jgi:hypothetical protein
MSPSYSAKNGVRYRFYVSSALLRGRKTAAGSMGRVAAAEIETAVVEALSLHLKRGETHHAPYSIAMLERVVVARGQLLLTSFVSNGGAAEEGRRTEEIRVAWSTKSNDPAGLKRNIAPEQSPNDGLLQSVIRAHAWMKSLREGAYPCAKSTTPRHAVAIEPKSPLLVSAKWEYHRAGRRFLVISAPRSASGSLETEWNTRKPGISGAFSRLQGGLAERRNAWLTSEDSNLHIPS